MNALHKKYDIRRIDGKDATGEKHYGCNYFVLDLTHDAYAIAAIEAYANSCEKDNLILALELKEWVDGQTLFRE